MNTRVKMLLRVVAAGLAFSVLLTVVACGGDDAKPTPAKDASAQATVTAPAASSTSKPVTPAAADLLALADGQALGKADAKVKITAFVDFQCPFCLLYTKLIEPVILQEYVLTGKVRYEVKNFPILGQESATSAVASRCAALQNKFFPFHDRLYQIQADAGQDKAEKLNVGRFADAELAKVVSQAGLDQAKYDACYASQEAIQGVADDVRAATTAGVNGTPGLLLNGKLVNTPANAAATRKLIDDALK